MVVAYWDCWLLVVAIGSYLLVVGCWLLVVAVSFLVVVVDCWFMFVGCGCWLLLSVAVEIAPWLRKTKVLPLSNGVSKSKENSLVVRK